MTQERSDDNTTEPVFQITEITENDAQESANRKKCAPSPCDLENRNNEANKMSPKRSRAKEKRGPKKCLHQYNHTDRCKLIATL